MVILRNRNKITDFFMILAWAGPFKLIECADANLQKELLTVCKPMN